MYTKDRDSAGTVEKGRIKRTDELNDDELDKFYCTNNGSLFLSFFIHDNLQFNCLMDGNLHNPLSTAWWMWSCSVSSYHLSKQSRWTWKFSWSSKQGFKCQKVLKGLETYKKSFSDRNNLQQKQCYPESILEYTNHDLRTIWRSGSQTGATWLFKGGIFNSWEEICSREELGKISSGWKKL